MTAGRFAIVEQPGSLRPIFLVVDMERTVARVVFTTDELDAAEWCAATLSDLDRDLPPVFDRPGEPSEEPW